MIKELNDFEVLQVVEDLRKKGIANYTMRPGNNCIWVTFNFVIDCYYIFRDSQIVDVQYD